MTSFMPPPQNASHNPSNVSSTSRANYSNPEVLDVIKFIHLRRTGKLAHIKPYQSFPLSQAGFCALLDNFADDLKREPWFFHKLRFNYLSELQLLEFTMSSPLHIHYGGELSLEINDQIEALGLRKQVVSCTELHVDLSIESSKSYQEPDVGVLARSYGLTRLAIEIAYSQQYTNLALKAKNYLLYSSGAVQRVIGIKLVYPPQKSNQLVTLSSWVATSSRNDKGDVVLACKQEIDQKILRDNAGNVSTDPEVQINFSIRDLYAEEVVDAKPNDPFWDQRIILTASKLCELLENAEEIQRNHISTRKALIAKESGNVTPLLAFTPDGETSKDGESSELDIGHA